ncbi:MAG: HAMP domain-containing sensor histidine kinase [Bdellovibrionota bacterium]
MTGKGRIATAPKRRLAVMLSVHLIWMFVVCLLGAWWGKLVLQQAARITELERSAGIMAYGSSSYLEKMHRMLSWELPAFFTLLIVSTAIVIWLYWRDLLRTKSLQAFFASVTHELRTPLTSIRLQAESIADSVPSGGHEHQLAERLLEDTTRLESQVEKMLELARVEGGGPVHVQPIQIKPWLSRFASSWHASFGNKINFDISIDDALIKADPAALGVILKNIVENSVKHSQCENIAISVRSVANRKALTLVFSDNGKTVQLNKKTMRTLGRAFEKGSASQGLGIGLYLIRTLMRRMGGNADYQFDGAFKVLLTFQEECSGG